MPKPMRRAFLMVGFNNWGKTTIIYDLFPNTRFFMGVGYRLREDIGRSFTVESASNDDIQGAAYTKKISDRVSQAPADAQNHLKDTHFSLPESAERIQIPLAAIPL